MSALPTLLRHELRRALRTHRVLVTGVLFVLIGLGSPLLAKLTPALLRAIPSEQLGGLELLLTGEPTQTDALVQYLKNFGLLPLLVVVSGMGALAGPRASGALSLLLARPLRRGTLAVAAFGVPAGLYGLGTALAGAGCLLYTQILFGGLDPLGFLALNALLWLHLGLVHAWTVLGSSLSRGAGPAAAIGLGGWLGMAALAALPVVGDWTPGAVVGLAGRLASGAVVHPGPAAASVVGALALTAGLVALAGRRLERAEDG